MRRTYLAVLFFALAGLVASISLTQLHFKIEQGGFEEKSFCNISEVVDCDTVLASRYSKIAGIPTSQLGVIYYLFFFLAALYAWSSEKGRRATLSFLLAASFLSILYSLYYGYISFARLGVVCVLCLTTYIANLCLLFLVPRLLEVRLHRVPVYLAEYAKSVFGRGEIPTRLGWHLLTVLVFLGGGLIFFKGVWSSDSRHPPEAKIPDELILKHFYSQNPIDFGLADPLQWGKEEAKVTIVEFSDFQCPYCKRAAFSLKPYLGELKREVRFVFVNYPLDNACNPQITRPMHPVACLAARAALCAHKKEKFWPYHDLIFENQKKLSRPLLLKLASQAGIDPDWMNVCLASGETDKPLEEGMREGVKFGVQGTPAIFVNGRPLRFWTDPKHLRLIVRSELERK